jgi:hypothetical protein
VIRVLAARCARFPPEAIGEGLAWLRPRLRQASPKNRGYFSRVEGAYLLADTCRMAMRIKRLPAGFVIPAQPVKASKPPSGADWVHEISMTVIG